MRELQFVLAVHFHRALRRLWLLNVVRVFTSCPPLCWRAPCASSVRDGRLAGHMDRRRSQPASEDSEDADTSSRDAEAWHDARVRGGVIRQSLPNALQHQVEAAQLASNKRQAEAARTATRP